MENKNRVFPNYENDIFISYSHKDNYPLEKGLQGWVDEMHERLARRLGELTGREPKIWRDPKLTGHDLFNKTIFLMLDNIAILLVVLSPPYVISEACLEELKAFYRKAKRDGRIKLDTKARIIKVIKTPIDEDEQPRELKGSLGYRFYEIDNKNGKPQEYKHMLKFGTFEKFLNKVDDIALDIRDFAKCQLGPIASPAGKTVYLAETEAEMDSKRDRIRRELQAKGYCILPNGDLNGNPSQLEQAIRKDLERSNLSIHLIGENYNDPYKPRPKSIVRMQHELAVERGSDEKFSQLIWMPKGLKAKADAAQQQLIDDLWSDASTRPNIEVLQDTLENLKKHVLDKLKSLSNRTPRTPPAPAQPEVGAYEERIEGEEKEAPETAEPVRIYLIHDTLDYEKSAQLRNFLLDEKFEVILTVTEGEVSEVVEAHKDNLCVCDAAIIFHGQANERWRQRKLCDFYQINSPSFGRTTEILGKGLYLSSPMTKQKEDFRSYEVKVMKEQDHFPPEGLITFLQELRARASKRNLKARGAGR
jgi:hypothetical protein